MHYHQREKLRIYKKIVKCALTIIVMLSFGHIAKGADESPNQILFLQDNHFPPSPNRTIEKDPKKTAINLSISDAFSQKTQRNLQFLIKAKLATESVKTERDYFRKKREGEQTSILPILGFRYQLSQNISLGAETELGYFKLSNNKWHSLDYSPPEDLFNVEDSILMHTDANIKFRF